MIEINNSVSNFDLLFNSDSLKHPSESEEHYEKKKEIARKLLDKGWKVGIEEWVDNPNNWNGYIVDVIAYKDGIWVAFEVGGTNKDKLDNLRDIFDGVKHTHYINSKGRKYRKYTGKSGPKYKPSDIQNEDTVDTVERKVWENSNGTRLLTVSGLLKTGRYKVKKHKNDDGTIVLTLKPKQDDES